MTIWQQRIKALKDSGMYSKDIAIKCNCSEGAISLLASGVVKVPSYPLGVLIFSLCNIKGIKEGVDGM